MLYRQVSRGHLASTHSYAVCLQRDGRAGCGGYSFRPHSQAPYRPLLRLHPREVFNFDA